jgi:selenide,water dikinase
VGANTADDAAVYKLNAELAVISTLDFFTPMLDDPYSFGQVAAANALSDIYAMGGVPFLALNIVVYPRKLPLEVLESILRGGADKVMEAGARLAGGHSIAEDSPMYGLAVNGLVHPDKIWTNAGAKPGDALVLTKPLGSGILCTAIKGGIATEEEISAVTEAMTTLNAAAAKAAADLEVHSCTDITGFGLLGHLSEMMLASNVRAELEYASIPLITGVVEKASMGMVPGGAYRNKKHQSCMVHFAKPVSDAEADVLFDPQTSGGLLFSLPEEDARVLTRQNVGWRIGRVLPPGEDGKLLHIV